jgi:hypothetical protein
MRAVASTLGIILMVLGIVVFAYEFDPIRVLLQATVPHRPNLVRPILGGLALVAGIALLYASQREQS